MNQPSRVAIFGDIGGHADLWSEKLRALGCDPDTGFIPSHLRVIQVGDLIHRGPDDEGCLAIASRFLEVSENRYDQLLGNHEGTELGWSTFSGFDEISPSWRNVLARWRETGLAKAAVAFTSASPGIEGEFLVSHAGLAPSTWSRLDLDSPPTSAYRTADLLNTMMIENPNRAFRAGVMLGDPQGRRWIPVDPGVTWAHSMMEVTYPWAMTGAAPFHQVHGHAAPYNWFKGRMDASTPDEIHDLMVVDPENRHTFITVDPYGHVVIGIDPSHGKHGANRWGPLIVDLRRP